MSTREKEGSKMNFRETRPLEPPLTSFQRFQCIYRFHEIMFDVLFWKNEVRSFNCDLRADSRTCVDIMSTVSVNLRRRQSIFTDLRYHFHKSIKIVRIRSVTPISYTQVKMTEFSMPLSLCFLPFPHSPGETLCRWSSFECRTFY